MVITKEDGSTKYYYHYYFIWFDGSNIAILSNQQFKATNKYMECILTSSDMCDIQFVKCGHYVMS
jgi:hypothetical protein